METGQLPRSLIVDCGFAYVGWPEGGFASIEALWTTIHPTASLICKRRLPRCGGRFGCSSETSMATTTGHSRSFGKRRFEATTWMRSTKNLATEEAAIGTAFVTRSRACLTRFNPTTIRRAG